jgi:squalene-associated FAD-dependent desaturase
MEGGRRQAPIESAGEGAKRRAVGTSVAVIGGGVAGIAAALECARAGVGVQLIEVRPRLGGAAYSFRREGLELDNGQHVFLRCCHSYRELLRAIGSERHVRIQRRLQIPVLSPGGVRNEIARSNLPAPLHLAGALLGFRLLGRAARLRAALAMRALAQVDPADPANDRIALGEWLSAHGQGEREQRDLWELFVLSTLNVPVAEASLALGAFALQTALLEDRSAADIGFHEAPLGRIIGAPAQATLAACGVEVELGARAQRIVRSPAGHYRLELIVAEGRRQELEADALVIALPHARAAALLEAPAGISGPGSERLAGLARSLAKLASAPIVNLHVIYDRPVTDLHFFAGARSPVQYAFDRSAAVGLERGRYLAVSLSCARAEMAMSVQRLRERYLPALGDLLPAARAAKVDAFYVSREHAATFAALPGAGALRPAAKTPLPGLLLAGAYTATGWPATLEGAARSGVAAARLVLAHLGVADRLARAGVRQAPVDPAQPAGERERNGAQGRRAQSLDRPVPRAKLDLPQSAGERA